MLGEPGAGRRADLRRVEFGGGRPADGTGRGGWMCGGRICGGQICGGQLNGRRTGRAAAGAGAREVGEVRLCCAKGGRRGKFEGARLTV